MDSYLSNCTVGFYEKMERNNILLSFKGDITSELVTSILQIMEAKLDSMNEEKNLKKKVFYVLVECLQNLHHHSEEEGSNSAMFAICKKENKYVIITGNVITKENVAGLDARLKELNTLTPKQLKDRQMSVLENGTLSKKGGGGLGMIEIARKTGKLIYEFMPIDDKQSFFSMTVTL